MKKIESYDWILLPGGRSAILRFPYTGDQSKITVPCGTVRRATHAEVCATALSPYPWGFSPENQNPSRLWKEKRIGYGGLVHSHWFVLDSGERIGAAPNVQEIGPGAQRYYLLTTGGKDPDGILNDNEGYAIVWDNLPEINRNIYFKIHEHVALHVTADRGGVVVSPVMNKDEITYVGFVGRCMSCPKPESISIRSLKEACTEIKIELHPDWVGWVL